MGKFDGILLMSDFDGTIYCNETVSEENRRAIKYFQSEGGLFTMASGRPPMWLSPWQEYFTPNTYCAMLNGTLICDKDANEFIYESRMENDAYDVARLVYKECPAVEQIGFFTYDKICKTKCADDICDENIKRPVFKLVVWTPADKSLEYVEKLSSLLGEKYDVYRSWINGIEIHNAGCGKGNAVVFLKKLLGEKARTVVAVGDFENDISMIRAADIGYAVGNALPSVKAAADRVTVDCTEHAIAKIIEDLEREL